MAITRWVPAGEVKPGDVIVVSHADRTPKIHRVVSIEEEDGAFVVETKGDANRASDPGYSVLNDRVPVLAYTIPYLGYAADFLRTPLGWTLFVLFPIGYPADDAEVPDIRRKTLDEVAVFDPDR